MITILKYFLKNIDQYFIYIFHPVDNEKGKKGKYIFIIIFIIILNDKIIFILLVCHDIFDG